MKTSDNIPTVEEFNRKLGECVEYKKLSILKETLSWFGGKIGDLDIIELCNVIDNRIKNIPEESINFDHEVHGEVTNTWK
tara:strand:+ start:196 stop:435 length:240 start_codon:yes stop_codon:yes gene_type:complete